MIKIISGYSYPAGGTLALVNLCNEFNSRGVACIFYGPDNWHVDKCKSGLLEEFSPEIDDIIIVNDVPLWSPGDLAHVNPLVKRNRRRQFLASLQEISKKYLPAGSTSNYKLLLTCQGGGAHPSIFFRLSRFHKIHFTAPPSNALKRFFRMAYPTFSAPNFSSALNKSEHKPVKIGGVIGSIKKSNNIVAAIEHALLDGMEKIIIFGSMKDPQYYYDKIAPLTITYHGKIKYAGFMDNRQKMYDAVSDVYSAVHKPWSVVSHECAMTHTRFHAPGWSGAEDGRSNDQIFDIWKKELSLASGAA